MLSIRCTHKHTACEANEKTLTEVCFHLSALTALRAIEPAPLGITISYATRDLLLSMLSMPSAFTF